MPTQLDLLKHIHSGIASSDSPVLVFEAPPASGKTHVIALCASYFQEHKLDSCVVTPNTELVNDFRRELTKVDSSVKPQVLNIGGYIRTRKDFQIALVDEAHNLRSCLELSPQVVRTLSVDLDSPLYSVVHQEVSPGQGTISKELAPESAHDILVKVLRVKPYNYIRRILRALTEWRVFLVYRERGLDIKFLSADPAERDLAPRDLLMLFSATPLDNNELEFYCNISPTSVNKFGNLRGSNPAKPNVRYLYFPCASDLEKRKVAKYVLKALQMPALVLINNHRACLQWSASLARDFEPRVVNVCSYLPYSARNRSYEKFVDTEDGILVTSSSVYWEGINIKNLRVVLVPNSPYPQPTLLEVASKANPRFDAVVKRRLIQGAGRVGRSPGTMCLCLLLFRPKGLTNFFSLTDERMLDATVRELAA